MLPEPVDDLAGCQRIAGTLLGDADGRVARRVAPGHSECSSGRDPSLSAHEVVSGRRNSSNAPEKPLARVDV